MRLERSAAFAGFANSANRVSSAFQTMNATVPRVAYFPDSFHEVNGVAHTSRHFEASARRLSVEKNVALLARVHEELEKMGLTTFRFLIVGHGAEENWMRERLPRAEFTGVLKGEALAIAYANMDLFVFPSHTDTFGNVVLEALASGVPAIVTPNGGPFTIVRDGETGRVASDDEFSASVAEVLSDGVRHAHMREATRAYALTAS
jgi:glycosyltransferase involved in cell wall biosynthesis